MCLALFAFVCVCDADCVCVCVRYAQTQPDQVTVGTYLCSYDISTTNQSVTDQAKRDCSQHLPFVTDETGEKILLRQTIKVCQHDSI